MMYMLALKPKTLNERKNRPERVVALQKQPQREIRVVAVKENDHNAFRHYRNTGRMPLLPRRDVRQVSTCRRVRDDLSASDHARSWYF
jgi:hypothetical protein